MSIITTNKKHLINAGRFVVSSSAKPAEEPGISEFRAWIRYFSDLPAFPVWFHNTSLDTTRIGFEKWFLPSTVWSIAHIEWQQYDPYGMITLQRINDLPSSSLLTGHTFTPVENTNPPENGTGYTFVVSVFPSGTAPGDILWDAAAQVAYDSGSPASFYLNGVGLDRTQGCTIGIYDLSGAAPWD